MSRPTLSARRQMRALDPELIEPGDKRRRALKTILVAHRLMVPNGTRASAQAARLVSDALKPWPVVADPLCAASVE